MIPDCTHNVSSIDVFHHTVCAGNGGIKGGGGTRDS